MPSIVGDAYSARAAEYVDKLGSIAAMHSSDVALITSWAAHVDGPILDAGCGPGHWTAWLSDHGNDVRGIDQVPEFVKYARESYPGVSFTLGRFDTLPDASGTVGGILAWYSLIHHEPSAVRASLDEFARILRPGGALLMGFFIGPVIEPFDHTVATAYRWPSDALSGELRAAGFEVIETHTRTGQNPKPRPHGAIIAQRAQLDSGHPDRP
ncbi:class I SAM-dependent methyltransferase [Microbacterium sp. RU33B]|uniref:class I SAM-dependent methyltransferase n=1 Tax=Microbacterium sp. RU33B TaxID=1907390 RepID=UPI0009630110|nr:class I SAM-dependent methyltransferase [Microbacterium sp. RU33B]SIT78777.1 Ubiquinone/menaquinone biosynthesis C-methylase UbiE [Microbacterium sp. RU33B]